MVFYSSVTVFRGVQQAFAPDAATRGMNRGFGNIRSVAPQVKRSPLSAQIETVLLAKSYITSVTCFT